MSEIDEDKLDEINRKRRERGKRPLSRSEAQRASADSGGMDIADFLLLFSAQDSSPAHSSYSGGGSDRDTGSVTESTYSSDSGSSGGGDGGGGGGGSD